MKEVAIVFILCWTLLSFAGCAKKEPMTVYKDVYIPVQCSVEMPVKPANNGTFKSHQALMIYYLECERLLKKCLNKEK